MASKTRLCITVPTYVLNLIIQQSYKDGRSMSNLCSYIIERYFTSKI